VPVHSIYLETFIVLNIKRMLNFQNLTVTVDSKMSGAEKYPDFFKVFLQDQHYERIVISSYTFCIVLLDYYSEYCNTFYGYLSLLKIIRFVTVLIPNTIKVL